MFTKYLITLFLISGAFAESCQNPKVEAASFTSLDATVVTQIAYITEFTLKCDNALPENYALYAEVEGKPLTAARIGENKYQVSITFPYYLMSKNAVVPASSDKNFCVSVRDIVIFDILSKLQ